VRNFFVKNAAPAVHNTGHPFYGVVRGFGWVMSLKTANIIRWGE